MKNKNDFRSPWFIVLAFATIVLAIVDAIIFINLAVTQDLTTRNVILVVLASIIGLTVAPMFFAIAFRIWLAKIVSNRKEKETIDVKVIVITALVLSFAIIVAVAVFLTRERWLLMASDRAYYLAGELESAGTLLHTILGTIPFMSIIISFCFSLLHIDWEAIYERLIKRKEPLVVRNLRVAQKKVEQAKKAYEDEERDFREKIDAKKNNMIELWVARLRRKDEIPFGDIGKFKKDCEETISENARRQAQIDFPGELAGYYKDIEQLLFHLKNDMAQKAYDENEEHDITGDLIKAIDLKTLIAEHNANSVGIYKWNTDEAIALLSKTLAEKLKT